MLGIFPCLQQAHRSGNVYLPCFLTTAENDGFFNGRALIQATDRGNSPWDIFSGGGSSERTLMYGLAVQDCPELTEDCLEPHFQTHIACILPRQYCA